MIVQAGSIIGTIFINSVFLAVVRDIFIFSNWTFFFIILVLSTLPLGVVIFQLKNSKISFKSSSSVNITKIDNKRIFLMCIFVFLAYADKLYEYPFEPWILEKFGETNFILFIQLLIILVFINLIGIIIAGFISSKFNKKKLLFVSSLTCGLLLLLIPFVDLIFIFICFSIIQILASFILVNMVSLIIKYSQNKVLYFQIMVGFAILARILFVPLGTYLSAIIPTPVIILISALLIMSSCIPIVFL
jgi:MFS family permease